MSLSIGRAALGVLALVFAPAAAGRAAPPDRVPLAVEDLYKLDAPRDAALAPDGKSLVYVRQWIDGAKVERNSLWRAAGDAPPAKPMEAGEPDARAPVYSPDGKWIAFVSTRPRPDGWTPTPSTPPQSDPATDVWLIPAAGGVAIPLAGKDKRYGRVFNDGFYGRLAFSPDGTKLAFVADDGRDPRSAAEKANGVAVARDDQGEGYTGWGAAQVWVAHLDPEPGASAAIKIDRLTDDDVWYGDPNWSPDGKTIAVHANRSTDRESVRFSINKNFDIWLIDRESKKVTQATSGPGPEVSPRFSPDGKRIACLSVPRKGTHRDECNLAVIDVSGPQPVARVLFDHHDATKDATGYPRPLFPLPVDCWDVDHLIFTAEAGADNELARASAQTGRGGKFAPAAPKGDGPPATPGERIALRNRLTPAGNLFLNERLVATQKVGSSRVDLQACKLEYSIVSPK